MADEGNGVCPRIMRNVQRTDDELHALAINLLVRSGVSPPGFLFQDRIILWHGTV